MGVLVVLVVLFTLVLGAAIVVAIGLPLWRSPQTLSITNAGSALVAIFKPVTQTTAAPFVDLALTLGDRTTAALLTGGVTIHVVSTHAQLTFRLALWVLRQGTGPAQTLTFRELWRDSYPPTPGIDLTLTVKDFELHANISNPGKYWTTYTVFTQLTQTPLT